MCTCMALCMAGVRHVHVHGLVHGRREAALAARGRELLGAAAAVAPGSLEAAAPPGMLPGVPPGVPPGVLLSEGGRRQAAGCLPLLLSHMATSPLQKVQRVQQ